LFLSYKRCGRTDAGGRIVAEYDSLSKKVAQLYTMKEMVLPEDEKKIYNKSIETGHADTNQQQRNGY
jgi:hypothetical protein